ncbi:hypothetical protein QO200_10005 [Flavobacterium sp. Arc3]|jgi:hypothetical protein|uniref:hypothetical protein n=1 Tax=unclassified Flavobacterium TaxID=196869 RepID=UPI00352C9DD0
MRISTLFFLFFSIGLLAQSTELEIKIDSISSIDADANQRNFVIHYQIENRTNHIISFILNPNSIRSNTTNSLASIPSYRLYQENVAIITDNIFDTKKKEKLHQKMMLEVVSNRSKFKENLDAEQKRIKTQTSKNIIKNIIKLNPQEIKSYTINLEWDKNRYIQYDDNEYYIDEKTTHYIDLHIDLFKEEIYQKLQPEDLNIILEDKTIIKGWLQSNKVPINFNN